MPSQWSTVNVNPNNNPSWNNPTILTLPDIQVVDWGNVFGTNNNNIRVSTNQSTGQIQVNQNVGIQKWIDAALSGLALIRGAGSIPTYTQQQQGLTQADLLALQQQQAYYQQQQGGNFGSQLQSFIQQNTGVVLLVGLGVVLFLMKPPSRR